jgi:hypothetical protein
VRNHHPVPRVEAEAPVSFTGPGMQARRITLQELQMQFAQHEVRVPRRRDEA